MRFLCVVLFGAALVVANVDHKVSRRRTPSWNTTLIDKLRSSLLLTYDKFARPAQPGNRTCVQVDWTLRHVDLDERQGTVTVNGWLRLSWLDEKLRWPPADFDGVTQVHVASHEIWQPDIVLYNSGSVGGTLDYYGNTQCVVSARGAVLWVPPFEFVAPCALDLTHWPYDVHTCNLELGSWTYDSNEVDLQLGEHVQQELLVHSPEWQVQGVRRSRHEGHAAWSDESRITLSYDILLERRAPAYRAIVVTPAFVIIIMTLLSCWLPPDAGEKLLLNASTAVILCVLLLHLGHKCTGGNGTHAPLLLTFYSSSLYVVTCSLVGCVCVLWVSRTHHHRPLPPKLQRALRGRAAHWLALHPYQQPEVAPPSPHADDDDVVDDDRERMLLASQTDWLLLAAAIDRISFFLYTILFAILAIVYAL